MLTFKIFKNSKIIDKGTFEIDGQQFLVFNGGPYFKFSEGISLFINCATQQEVDELWEKLSADGGKSQCGWVKDKFGVSWQIVPSVLGDLMSSGDPVKTKRVTEAFLRMKKFDIAELRKAFED